VSLDTTNTGEVINLLLSF